MSLHLLCALLAGVGPDLPPLSDLQRFPPREVARANRQFAVTAREYLRARWAVETWRQPDLLLQLDEFQAHLAAWNALEDAWLEHYDETTRRAKLAFLRHLIGDERYAAGAMPPPVPWWRFADVTGCPPPPPELNLFSEVTPVHTR